MTASTGKRSYRACLRCRRRKVRCDFDGIGEPRKAPCVSCHLSGSECILAESRRGGNFRHQRATSAAGIIERSSSSLGRSSAPEEVPLSTSYKVLEPSQCPANEGDSGAEQGSGDVLAMELRNPSDALQILARSGQTQNSSQSPVQTSNIQNATNIPDGLPRDGPRSSLRAIDAQQSSKTTPTFFEDYELVQRGLLRPSLVSELLFIYHHKYHPYFPIVPSSFLKPGGRENLQKPDYFLITAILTIASRDETQHSLTHRYCWDHAQRLLIEVLLAHPWTQTPRTVEGLLILAEWLPHIQIQETASESPKSLFSEDRTAWSLVGLAVRQGYLQRLDQGAFRNSDGSESKEQSEQNRLIWAYIFMADRQISVRLGQSFWSRGPSLNSNFTAKDFPSLQPHPDGDSEDYASMLQASMELTQILHNAHAVLYSSKSRTMAMVLEGNYARYLDDFRTSGDYLAFDMERYCGICEHKDDFDDHAVLTRASMPRATNKDHHNGHIFAELFAGGIMLSPDGRYIFDAISAAMNLLGLMNSLDPRQLICYLPSRYYLYGVYAAVLLHKADCAGAFQTSDQRQEVISLARNFVAVMKRAASTESHICHTYARMLKQLWARRERTAQSTRNSNETTTIDDSRDTGMTNSGRHMAENDHRPDQDKFISTPHFFGASPMEDSVSGGVPSIENYLLGSFMPGIADFSTTDFDISLGQDYQFMGGFQDWPTNSPEILPHGNI